MCGEIGVLARRDRGGFNAGVIEVLPATAVAGAVLIGAARQLGGAVEVEPLFEDAAVHALVTAGCGVLRPRGRRGRLTLAASPPAGVTEDGALMGAPTDTETPTETVPGLSALLEAKLGGLAFGERPGPRLWRRVARETRALLDGLGGRSGAPPGRTFLVRCDAETNEGAGDDVVVEILVRDAARVERVVFRVGQM